MNLTAVVLTKNEEKNIKPCIKSLMFADEVIVIDDNSTDKTSLVVKGLGAKVFTRGLRSDFSAQRNYGLEKAKGKWVLFVDADERVSNKLASEILEAIRDSENNGYRIKRNDYLFGKKMNHGEVGNVWLLRLGKRNSGMWRRAVHEVWDIKGEVGKLNNPIDHYPHESLSEFLDSINVYSSIHARENAKEGKYSSIFKIVLFPTLKFIDNMILKLGVLDGTRGFVTALFMSMHSFLAWSKLWIHQRKS